MNNNLYTEDSIQSLSPLEFTRLRPGVYCGNTDYSTQLLVEIVSNCVDEISAGHGDTVIVNITNDNWIRVEDNCQGFLPNVMREDGKSILEASFSVLNTSGKYSEDGVYTGTALGLNGIGSKICVYLSHQAEVTTWRDGEFETVDFIEGVFYNRTSGKPTYIPNSPSGTVVKWLSSEEFFKNPRVDLKVVKDLFSVLVCLCPNLTIEFTDEASGFQKRYRSRDGLNDLIPIDNEILKNRLNINYKNGKNKLDLVMTFTDDYSSTILPYVNTGLTDSGPHITQIKTIITREFNKFFKEKKWIKDNLSGDEIQEGLYLIFNMTTPGVSYDAQTKSRVVGLDMSPFATVLAEQIQMWLKSHEKQIKAIADKAILARKAKEASKKARDAVRQPKEKGLKAKLALSKKFTDCASKDPKKRNLLLVEGRSAGSSAVEARNPDYDCIYQLRGKPISPLKTSVEKILANQEMSDIIRVLGAGFDKDFNVKKMNFNKVVIVSDADADGEAIELLLTTFFFTYMRPLIKAGKLYRAVTPLYIVRKGKEEEYFYTEEEMDDWRKLNKTGWDIIRAKGLGELNPKDLQNICFKNERYKRITISDIEKSKELLEVLEGKAVEPRKKYVYENATALGFNFD